MERKDLLQQKCPMRHGQNSNHIILDLSHQGKKIWSDFSLETSHRIFSVPSVRRNNDKEHSLFRLPFNFWKKKIHLNWQTKPWIYWQIYNVVARTTKAICCSPELAAEFLCLPSRPMSGDSRIRVFNQPWTASVQAALPVLDSLCSCVPRRPCKFKLKPNQPSLAWTHHSASPVSQYTEIYDSDPPKRLELRLFRSPVQSEFAAEKNWIFKKKIKNKIFAIHCIL